MSGSERIVEDGGRTPRAELVRGLGLMAAVSVNVANMIGTGVFLKTRVMTCNVGSPMLVLAAWLAAGLVVLVGTAVFLLRVVETSPGRFPQSPYPAHDPA